MSNTVKSSGLYDSKDLCILCQSEFDEDRKIVLLDCSHCLCHICLKVNIGHGELCYSPLQFLLVLKVVNIQESVMCPLCWETTNNTSIKHGFNDLQSKVLNAYIFD